MCCRVIKKGIEWFGMIVLWVYSVVTICYIICQLLLSITYLYLLIKGDTASIIDYGFLALGLIVAGCLYIVSLACLTATERMVGVADRLCIKAPGY